MVAPAVTRRRVVAGLSTVGLVSTVGCLGGDSQRLTLAVGPEGSRSHRAGQALSVAVDRHGEDLSLRVESVDTASNRLYAVSDGEVAVGGVDNTTLYRASEGTGVFDLDPVDELPYQGFSYGWLDSYWLTATDPAAGLDSTSDLDEERIYPDQPGTPSRLLTEQLLRAADRWDADGIDNRPRAQIPDAVEAGEIDILAAVERNGQRLVPWCRRLDEQAGGRLGTLQLGEEFQAAIESAPNAVATEVDPAGWERAGLDSVDGWRLPMQWLVSPTADSGAVAELTRIAHEHTGTIRTVDDLAVDGSEPTTLATAVIEAHPVHEGVASVFRELDVWDDDWTVGDAVD